MGFIDDIKEDQKMQIQVVCVAFFLLAFPSYFFLKAAATDDPAGMGGVGTYSVTGDLSYIDFDNGSEDIANGQTISIPLNTDSLDSMDMSKNIVGVLVTMTYDEDESVSCLVPGANGQNAPDTITGTATHDEFTNTESGQNGASNSHTVATEWYNSTMIDSEVSGLSESEIVEQLDSNGAGLGDYTIEIRVDAQAGNSPNPSCTRSDDGENISYNIQLIVLDFEITPYIEIEDI